MRAFLGDNRDLEDDAKFKLQRSQGGSFGFGVFAFNSQHVLAPRTKLI